MMNGLLVAGLILGVGAPAPKEAPKKGPAIPSIVGMWETQKYTAYGMDIPGKPMLFEFTADGQFKMTKIKEAQTSQSRYKLDASKDPAELDWLMNGDETKRIRGIYKIDGDTLTVCIEDGFDSKRPTKFESLKGTKTMIWTLKRVEKKKE